MSYRKTIITGAIAGLGLLIQLAGPAIASTSKGFIFDCEFEPTQMPLAPGPVELRFSVTPNEHFKGRSTVALTVTTQSGLEYSGPKTWAVDMEQSVKYTELIHVSIPPNDTCGIRIELSIDGRKRHAAHAWFVTFDESVEFWKGSPRGATPRNKMSFGESRRAELTPEQLAQVMDWEVSLKDVLPKNLQFVLPMLGELTPTERDSVFHIRISRETYWKLWDRGIHPEWLENPPPPREPNPTGPPPHPPETPGG
ncbi:MAG: hypothetical protein OEV49_09410, partial [candidate division Zixibacteria bacterium]|nr:hypothetical protein [candidate division Zixibacteria bacterium]